MMMNSGTLTVTTPSEREVQVTRAFAAPRHLVFRALTTPQLLMIRRARRGARLGRR
jgi:hypothetical protein